MKSKKTINKWFTFKHLVEVKARLLDFQLSPSLKYLDADALSRVTKAKIDVGFYKGGCCNRHVLAVIEAGMVTKLEMDPCHESKPATPELSAMIKAALKRAGRSGSAKWRPIPVKEFLSQSEAMVVFTTANGTVCVVICIIDWCVLSCHTPKVGKSLEKMDVCFSKQ